MTRRRTEYTIPASLVNGATPTLAGQTFPAWEYGPLVVLKLGARDYSITARASGFTVLPSHRPMTNPRKARLCAAVLAELPFPWDCLDPIEFGRRCEDAPKWAQELCRRIRYAGFL